MTAGDDGANTSHAKPLRMRSASCFDVPAVRLMVTPAFFASNAFFCSRMGPASESAWNTSIVPAIALPANQFLGGKAYGDHHELQIKPVRLEPQEQVDAEDDRERPETERVGLPARPHQQHVERIRKRELRRNQRHRVIDGPPVPAPVEKHARLGTRLKVVLGAQLHFERQRAIAHAPPQCGSPQHDERRRGQNRFADAWVLRGDRHE